MLLLEHGFVTSSETAILTQKHQLLPFSLILVVSIKIATPMVLWVRDVCLNSINWAVVAGDQVFSRLK